MFRSVRLPGGVKGELFLHSMPGRDEEFDASVSEIINRKIDEVVCLATDEEIIMKSPLYKYILQTKKYAWHQTIYSIPNFGAPSDKEEFLQFTRDLAGKLLSGNKLLVHCGGGIGRTGMLAVALLMCLGVEMEEARETVASAQSSPDTTPQNRLLEWLALQLK